MARLMARVLAAWQHDGKCQVRALLLSGGATDSEFPFPVCRAQGSRLRFGLEAQRLILGSDLCIYDCANMARVHRLLHRWCPSLVYMHGVELWENTQPKWLTACRRASLRLANSRYTLDHVEQLHGDMRPAEVCWLATEEDDAPRIAVPVSARGPRVLIVGRIAADEAYKGHRELIDAWPRVLESVPAAQLHVVGRGSGLADVQRLASASSAAGQIVFHGFVEEERLRQLYEESMVFAMPSRGEGFGLVYADAMRHRLPVIASAHDAGAEVVDHGVTGFCVDLQDPSDLPQRLIELLTSPPQAEAMGQAGQRRWQEHFRFSAFRTRFERVLEGLCSTEST